MGCNFINATKPVIINLDTELLLNCSSSLNCLIITGSNFNDRLIGNACNNTIYGMKGNDILNGRGGYNILVGGQGIDKFIVSQESSVIRITDFETFEPSDKIDLSEFHIIDNFNDIKKQQVGGNTQIIIDNNHKVIIENILPDELKTEHFILTSLVGDKKTDLTNTLAWKIIFPISMALFGASLVVLREYLKAHEIWPYHTTFPSIEKIQEIKDTLMKLAGGEGISPNYLIAANRKQNFNQIHIAEKVNKDIDRYSKLDEWYKKGQINLQDVE